MFVFNKLMIAGFFLLCTVFAGCQTNEKPDQQGMQEDEIVVKVRYYSTGAVETETEYVNNIRHGMHKLYHEDGSLISEVRFINGKMEGFMKTYFTDGTLKVLVPYENGIAHGEMISYHPGGKIWRKQVYDRGKLMSTKQYTEDGKLEFEDNF